MKTMNLLRSVINKLASSTISDFISGKAKITSEVTNGEIFYFLAIDGVRKNKPLKHSLYLVLLKHELEKMNYQEPEILPIIVNDDIVYKIDCLGRTDKRGKIMWMFM